MKIVYKFSESDCIRQVKLGDERAFDQLFRQYSALVYRFSYSYLKSRVEAEEIVQECFLKVWEKRLLLREDVPLKGYLFTIAHHAVLNLLRHSRHRARFQTHLAALRPAVATNAAEYSEMEALYQAALEKLPPKRRQIFILSRQQGLSYPEIAQQLDLSVKTVEAQIVQALKFLRLYFRAHGSEILVLLALMAGGVK